MKKNTKGFTLIELLIVVVIIGILAAIAIPKFASTKQNAYLAAMKTDLRNLATAEEAYQSNYNTYIPTQAGVTQASTVAVGSTVFFAPSAGVTVSITSTPPGWSATATHAQATGHTCAIYYNVTTAVAPATNEGEPKCN